MSDCETRVLLDRDGRIIFETQQDVEPLLDINAEQRNHGTVKTPWGRKIATIPNVLFVKWMNEEGVNYFALNRAERDAFLKRKLRDPDYRRLRSVDGRI